MKIISLLMAQVMLVSGLVYGETGEGRGCLRAPLADDPVRRIVFALSSTLKSSLKDNPHQNIDKIFSREYLASIETSHGIIVKQVKVGDGSQKIYIYHPMVEQDILELRDLIENKGKTIVLGRFLDKGIKLENKIPEEAIKILRNSIEGKHNILVRRDALTGEILGVQEIQEMFSLRVTYINDNEKEKIRNAINSLSVKVKRFTPKEAMKHSEGIKSLNGIKWEEIIGLLNKALEKGDFFKMLDKEFSSQAVSMFGNNAFAIDDRYLNRGDILPIMLAREAIKTYYSRLSNSSPESPDISIRATLSEFGLYCILTDAERRNISYYYQGLFGWEKEKYDFFNRVYNQILQKHSSVDLRSEIAKLIQDSGKYKEGFTIETPETAKPVSSPQDNLKPFDMNFLRSSMEYPNSIVLSEGVLTISRENPERNVYSSVSVNQSLALEEKEERKDIIVINQKDGFSRKTIKISVRRDDVYGKIYTLEVSDAYIFSGDVNRKIGELQNALKTIRAFSIIFDTDLREHGILWLLGGWFMEDSYSPIDDKKQTSEYSNSFDFATKADKMRVEEERRQEELKIEAELRRQAELLEAIRRQDIEKNGLTTDNAKLKIIYDEYWRYDSSEKFKKIAGTIAGRFNDAGFKHVDILAWNGFYQPQDEDIILFINDRNIIQPENISTESRIFELKVSAEGDIEGVLTLREARKGKLKRIAGGRFSPEVVADSITRMTIQKRHQPAIKPAAVLTELPQYEGSVSGEEKNMNRISIGIIGFPRDTADSIKAALSGRTMANGADSNSATTFNIEPRIIQTTNEANFCDVIITRCTDDYGSLWNELINNNPDSLVIMYDREKGYLGRYHEGELTQWKHSGGRSIPAEEAGLYALSEFKEAEQFAKGAEKKWTEKMRHIAKGVGKAIDITMKMEQELVEKTRFCFNQRPSCYFRDKRPFLVFESLEAENKAQNNGISLREDDEIEITFGEGAEKRTWKAVVSEIDGERMVCPIPGGMDFRKDLKEKGAIKKIYNDVSFRTQLDFMSELEKMIDAPGYTEGAEDLQSSLVGVALGLTPLSMTQPEDECREVALNNPGIGNNEQQLKLLSAGLNGASIELGWGPPGTGKTTIAGDEYIYQNYLMGKSQLVAAQTNRAVDNLLIRAKRAGVKVYRVGNHPQIFDPELREDWIYNNRPVKPKKPRHYTDEDTVTEEMLKKAHGLPEWGILILDPAHKKMTDADLRRILNDKMDKEWIRANDEYESEHQKWKEDLTEEICSGRAIVGGTCVGIAIDKFLDGLDDPAEPYSYVKNSYTKTHFKFKGAVVEEASVASFGELLLVLSKAEEKAFIIGDPDQLGVSPVQYDLKEKFYEAGLDSLQIKMMQTSLFEFLLGQQRFNITMLEDCYRMTPLLVELTNFFYDGKLKCMRTDISDEADSNSLIVIDTKNLPNKQDIPVGTSWMNRTEAEITQEVTRQLGLIGGIDADDIGIISPYAPQVRNIREGLQRWLGKAVPDFKQRIERTVTLMKNIGTAWPFQGREKRIVVVSFVRSKPPVFRRGVEVSKTGFMDWKMMNVITSRGQDCTIVILDSDTFLKSPREIVPEFIRHMLRLAKEKGVYISLDSRNPLPDLRRNIAVIRQHLLQTYGKPKMPLVLSGQAPTQGGVGAVIGSASIASGNI
ncbi:MAG: AAA domain-containing protein [Candidatus Omnitrophota bacterium]|nr:AAA domain-containing protein [Candidatus Omnitrophota bacterium]